MQVEDINSALHVFNLIEDKRDALRDAYETKDKKLRDAQAEVEQFLLEEMKRMNLASFELPNEGVCKIKTVRHFGAADWGAVWTWIIENKAPNFLQKRLLDSEIQKYLDEHGTLPPGVNSRAHLEIAVTKRPPK